MNYEDGPVLMEGSSDDHEGASSSFEFEIVEEHDPERMKKNPEDEEEMKYGKDDEEEEKARYKEEDKEEDSEEEEEEEKKGFLTINERELLALILKS